MLKQVTALVAMGLAVTACKSDQSPQMNAALEQAYPDADDNGLKLYARDTSTSVDYATYKFFVNHDYPMGAVATRADREALLDEGRINLGWGNWRYSSRDSWDFSTFTPNDKGKLFPHDKFAPEYMRDIETRMSKAFCLTAQLQVENVTVTGMDALTVNLENIRNSETPTYRCSKDQLLLNRR